MHGWRRWLAAGVGIAAGAVCAPGTASAAGLIAAYEYYVPGKGFEIGLKNAQTGANLSLPAGINTTDDELHPALSRDGRHIVFERMKLLPGLSGDFLPPEQRTLHRADRQAGTVTQFFSGTIAGPAFVRGRLNTTGAVQDSLSWGNRPAYFDGERSYVSRHSPLDAKFTPITTISNFGVVESGGGNLVEVTHAAVDGSPFENPTFGPGIDRMMLTIATVNATTGALVKSVAYLGREFRQGTSLQTNKKEFGAADAPASHPMPRAGDATVALAMTPAGGNSDIFTTTLPTGNSVFSVPNPAAAPEAINTSAPEQMPAWSPDDLKLGFVRTSGGRRRLAVFNATPGIQAILNTPVDLGAEAPTPQTRSFQSVWGGLSVAETTESAAPLITCGQSCVSQLQGAGSQTVPLAPRVSGSTTIGIFVVRVTGKRKLLGRTVPRVRVVGRVPLGRAKKGGNRFRWNGKVAGKRLRRGTYLLTYRSLKGKRITNTSDSIRFKVTKGGKIRGVRRQR